MRVLRAAFVMLALAGFAAPAVARIDDEFPASLSNPAQDAVHAALDQATDSGDRVEKHVLDGVRKFYAARGYAPLWIAAGPAPEQMGALRHAMDQAADYGLDPAAYATPLLAAQYPDDPNAIAAADVAFSLAVARFVTHIASGRTEPSEIAGQITLHPERPDIGALLTKLSQSSDITADLAGYEPPHPQYFALKAALAKLRAEPEAERIVVPDGRLMRPGKSDPRVPTLRERLGLTLTGDAEPEIYDKALVDAVKAFQSGNGLKPDGIVGPSTLFVMNGRSRDEQIASIVANLERWRWMPRDLGPFYVMVNVPEYTLRVVDDGNVVHETRVVVGKPTNPTPFFSSEISYLIVNPYWHVPTSIISKEMLPEIRSDPYGYFARQGYEVFLRYNGKFRQVDPRWVNWYVVNPRDLQIRQVPGDDNALGRIKFMFPNQYSVYLHDTPSKSFFLRDKRDLSHGCVRVQNPLDFADSLLKVASPDWNSKRLEKLFGGAERRVNLKTHVPVHLAYFTEWVDPDGTLQHFDDIYGYDSELSRVLG